MTKIKNPTMVIDNTKPLVKVIDAKPDMKVQNQNIETEQLYSITIGAGMYLGIPIITYPTAQTFLSSKSP